MAIDPDSELVTATAVTSGNVSDAVPAVELLADVLDEPAATTDEPTITDEPVADDEPVGAGPSRPVAYGDNAYGTGELHSLLENSGVEDRLKTQSPSAAAGRFTKDRFAIDLETDRVTCPAGVTVTIRRHKDGSGTASFANACATCPLRDSCTASPSGRVVNINRNERVLADARARQTDPAWRDDYRTTRPKVERKLAHLVRRRHGGRRARVRGRLRVNADFNLLAGAHNLARLALLGLHSTPTGWSAA